MENGLYLKGKMIGCGKPKVCVPLTFRKKEEILAQVEKIATLSKQTNVDIVEFRADYYEDLADKDKLRDLLGEINARLGDIILLFTIRSEAEGGEKLSFDTPSVNKINEFVIENKLADMVDLELFSGETEIAALVKVANEKGVKIIMSNHDFNTTPAADIIVNRLTNMQTLGADIVKIAVMPENKMQLIELLEALTTMNEKYAKVPVVAISMGKLGAISRISGELFGSAITFAALEGGSAPGQIPVNELNQILDSINRYCV